MEPSGAKQEVNAMNGYRSSSPPYETGLIINDPEERHSGVGKRGSFVDEGVLSSQA